MKWLLIIIIFIVLFFVIAKLFGLGHWKKTLNQVISAYIAVRQLDPGFSDKEVFMSVIDGRFRAKMFQDRKNDIKIRIENEIESGFSIINKYNLPNLIYACLLIEKNNVLQKYSTIDEFIKIVTEEVNRQGFSKYV